MRQDDFYNLIYQVILVASSTEFFKILPRGIETILWDFILPSFTIWSLYSPKILSKKLENKLMDLNWGKCHFERILSNIITIYFGKYIGLHHLDVKSHVFDRLCKRDFSILRILGTYFDNYLKNALFGIFGPKVGILSAKNIQKGAYQP